jgi:3-methyladenine DNA glycosylase AlkD
MTGSLASLEEELRANSDAAKRAWWSNYVKGAAFYGVPMADTRRIGLKWWSESDHADPLGEILSLGQHPITEVRLVGISILERVLIPEEVLDASDLNRIRAAMDNGAFDDWNTCDWFCVKVLHQLMAGGPPEAHIALLAWSDSSTLWAKRASLVGFVNLLPKSEPSEGFDSSFIDSAATVVEDQRRFCQTSIGWTMRELSVRDPARVEGFLGGHLAVLSREAITNASKKLESPVRRRLLDAHTGSATSTH